MADVLGTSERLAVFLVHDQKCYIDSEPLYWSTFEVDHVIPERLINDPGLVGILKDLGRPTSFQISSFENWLPVCRPHNGKKSARPWDPSLLAQQALQRAADRAGRARAEAATFKARANVARVIALLQLLRESDAVPSPEDVAELKARFAEFASDQGPDLVPGRVQLTPDLAVPLYEVISDDGHTKVVRGPFGVGGGPSDRGGRVILDELRCGSCGLPWFSGARCVICGALSDGD